MNAPIKIITAEALAFLKWVNDHPNQELPAFRTLGAELGISHTAVNKFRVKLVEAGLMVIDIDGPFLTDAGIRELDAQKAANADREGVDLTAQARASIPLTAIRPSALNPRKHFDQDALEELAASIRQDGLIEPLKLHELGAGQYEIIAGERRWRALCINRDLYNCSPDLEPEDYRIKPFQSEARHRAIALIENMQRENLSPMEEARAFDALADCGWSNGDIADAIKKTVRFVQDRRALTAKLAPEIVTALEQGQITVSHARELARANHAIQLEWLDVTHGMSIDEDVAAFVRTRIEAPPKEKPHQRTMGLAQPDQTEPEETKEDDGEETIDDDQPGEADAPPEDDDPEQTNEQPAEPPPPSPSNSINQAELIKIDKFKTDLRRAIVKASEDIQISILIQAIAQNRFPNADFEIALNVSHHKFCQEISIDLSDVIPRHDRALTHPEQYFINIFCADNTRGEALGTLAACCLIIEGPDGITPSAQYIADKLGVRVPKSLVREVDAA